MTFRELLAEDLKNPEFRKEWEESRAEFQQEVARIRAEIEADEKAGIDRRPKAYLEWMSKNETAGA